MTGLWRERDGGALLHGCGVLISAADMSGRNTRAEYYSAAVIEHKDGQREREI